MSATERAAHAISPQGASTNPGRLILSGPDPQSERDVHPIDPGDRTRIDLDLKHVVAPPGLALDVVMWHRVVELDRQLHLSTLLMDHANASRRFVVVVQRFADSRYPTRLGNQCEQHSLLYLNASFTPQAVQPSRGAVSSTPQRERR